MIDNEKKEEVLNEEKEEGLENENTGEPVSEEDALHACEEAAAAEEGQMNQEEEAGENPGAGDSKFFKKKAKGDKKQEALKQKIEELEDKTKRQMAEFENFRKRSEKEKSMMFETGAKSVIEKILPIIDNFERGLESIPEEEKNAPFPEGMNLVYKQLMSELETIGVKPIEAVGTEFNPDLHDAVMQVDSEEYEPGIVAQEMRKGYFYRESVVRHSMVAVVS